MGQKVSGVVLAFPRSVGLLAVTQLRALRKSRGRRMDMWKHEVVQKHAEDAGCVEEEAEVLRGVPLQPPPLLGLLRLEAGGYGLERDG